jgi:hypothetical protein
MELAAGHPDRAARADSDIQLRLAAVVGLPGVLLVAVRVHPRRRRDDVNRLSDDAAAVPAVVRTGGAFVGAHLAGAVLVGLAFVGSAVVYFAVVYFAVVYFAFGGTVVVGLAVG